MDTEAEELRQSFLSLPSVIIKNDSSDDNQKLISAKKASSLLKKEGIPENQHPGIIKKLGFDISVSKDGRLRQYIGGTLNDAVIKDRKGLIIDKRELLMSSIRWLVN